MTVRILSSTALAAWAAATTQQAQLEGLRDEWSGQMSVRYYSSADAHLATVTHATPIVDTATTPRSLRLGAWVAESHVQDGTAAYAILAVPAGADILRSDVALAGPISDPGGRVRVDIGTTLRVQATSTLQELDIPAWRTAMTAEDTLYYVTSQAPSYAPALTLPTRFGNSGTQPATATGAGWGVMSGYSSGQLLADVGGQYGTMVYGTGGHKILANQLLGLDLNDDAPTWSWWHDPTYKTSDTGSANLYYAPSEETALVAGARGTAARIVSNDFGGDGSELATAAAWDRQFPVAFEGWIFPRKLTTGQMGDNVPHGFRYSSTAYIPASVTGTDPMFFTVTGAQGPFDQNAKPAGVSDADWFDSAVLISGNRRKYPYYFRNCTTGAWAMHSYQPDGMDLADKYSSPLIGVFEDNRRIYVVGGNANYSGYYYIDMSAGYASHTISATVGGQIGGHRYAGACFSNGDPLGRHFMVTCGNESNTTKIVVYDLDTETSFQVDLNSYGFSFDGDDERIGLSYDPTNQRVLVMMFNNTTGAPFYWSIAVPSTLTNSAGWVASQRSLTYNDAGMASTIFQSGQNNQNKLCGFYGKTRLHPTLGCILVPSADYRMTAFVPSA